MTIKWESLTNRAGVVRFGSGGNPNQRMESISPREMTGASTSYKTNRVSIKTNSVTLTRTNVTSALATNRFYLYEAVLQDLQPGAKYVYTVDSVHPAN